MKYGVVYYKDTDNIGDDIQSFAAMQFLPKIDYLIDREKLNEFQADEEVATILNGWFLHNKFSWPPSKDIHPLCVSMHFSKNDYIGIGYKFLDGIGGEYLKNYEPIGCRDLSTKNVLDSKGIQNYLSGCVTLTLRKREKKDDFGKYICVVDVPDEVEELVRLRGAEKEIKKLTHWVDYDKYPISWKERINKVEEVLDIYQNAFCVVTKRLHCALPCLALGTPVLLILDTDKDDVTRYSHFIELLHVKSKQEFIDEKCEYDILNPPQNKEVYCAERQKLIETISKFVEDAESGKICNNFNKWKAKQEKDILEWRQELSINSLQYAAKQIDTLLREKNAVLAKTYEENEKFAKQYSIDMDILEAEIINRANEINRLSQIIEEKNAEERRLNHVVEEKNAEEHRLNQIIEEKNAEECRLSKIIEEKNLEERRLNRVIDEKNTEENRLNQAIINKDGIINNQAQIIEHYKLHSDRILECYEKFESTSIIWVLFFSRRFKKYSFKQKLKKILETLTVKSTDAEKSSFSDLLLELRQY